jgi:selenide,water dikinase
VLTQVLRPLQELFPQIDYPDLLIGLGKPDDAAVWRLDDDQALVVTVDFFTPVVDTPYEYGAIAAANALSDIYAMGARPILALNVAAMPPNLPVEITTEIFRGGAEKVREAGAAIAGGHTLQDKEPKYGLVAIGLVAISQLMTKTNAKEGDLLILTKPLGTGVTTTALKNEICTTQDAEQAIHWMSTLNQKAAEIAGASNVRSGTDISGFGFLGHSFELANGSNVGLRFWLPNIPFLHGSKDYAHQGNFPGGSIDNKLFFGELVSFDAGIDDYQQLMLFDAQTSGGLLLAVPPDQVEIFMALANEQDQPAWVIGEVVAGSGIQVTTRQPDKPIEPPRLFNDLFYFE